MRQILIFRKNKNSEKSAPAQGILRLEPIGTLTDKEHSRTRSIRIYATKIIPVLHLTSAESCFVGSRRSFASLY